MYKFRIYDNVIVWDSSNPFAEEYIRGCTISPRDASVEMYTDSYTKCQDYIHTGNVALFHATQILVNHLCNRHVRHFKI